MYRQLFLTMGLAINFAVILVLLPLFTPLPSGGATIVLCVIAPLLIFMWSGVTCLLIYFNYDPDQEKGQKKPPRQPREKRGRDDDDDLPPLRFT